MNNLIARIELLKVVTHPARITILSKLTDGVKCVTDLQDFLKINQSNVSQHLSALRHAGIIDFFVDGRLRCYYLKEPFIPDLLKILNKEYPEEIPAPECCPVTKKGKYPGNRKH